MASSPQGGTGTRSITAMPTFRPRPPTLLGVTRPHPTDPDPTRIHLPVSEAVVDCAVYADGHRLPGKFSHAGALIRTRDLLAEGRKAFVWI